MNAWKATPASAKDLKKKGILARHELLSATGERLALVLESGGWKADSLPVAVVVKDGKAIPMSHPSVDAAKTWAEAMI